VKRSHYFKNTSIKVLTFLYFSAGIVIDILCLLSFNSLFPEIFLSPSRYGLNIINFIEAGGIFLLFFSLILQIIIETTLSIKEALFFSNDEHLNP
jgi:hypothetical protein